jgi:sigma-B regulation protein RsbU (phosphoserine phosphatase)
MPIGIAETRCRELAEPLKIEPGDLLVLATDGTVEQRGASRELFGKDRLLELVRESQHLPAAEIVRVIREAITERYTGAHPDDDVTLLVLERKQPTA